MKSWSCMEFIQQNPHDGNDGICTMESARQRWNPHNVCRRKGRRNYHILRISSYRFTILWGFHCADSVVRIPFYKFYTNPLCGFNCANATVRIPLCAFCCVHSVVCIPSVRSIYSIVRQTEEGRGKEGRGSGTLALCIHICICTAVGINRDASTESVLSESYRLGLHQPDYIDRIVCGQQITRC